MVKEEIKRKISHLLILTMSESGTEPVFKKENYFDDCAIEL